MRPVDIIPGQFYRNHNAFGINFLGVKKNNKGPNDGNFELILVCVTEGFVFGHSVCAPEYCADGYWRGFYPVDNPNAPFE
jgi:hypothetical protein